MGVEKPPAEATSPSATRSPARGPRIPGPVAIGVDAGRFFSLTRTLAVTEFKLRFFGSALGYFWQLRRPLLLFGVMYVMFTQVLRFSSDAEFYPVALLAGIVIFSCLTESAGTAVSSLVDRESLVRKVQFPRLAIPISIVATALMNLTLNLLVVLVFLLASGGAVRIGWLEIPLLVSLLALFAGACSTLLSALYVRYRDVRPVWDVLMQMLFYATPIFYTLDVVGNTTIERLLLLNPLAAIIQQFRHAVIDPSHPSVFTVMGGSWALTLIPLAVLMLLVVFAYRYFNREAPLIAEEL